MNFLRKIFKYLARGLFTAAILAAIFSLLLDLIQEGQILIGALLLFLGACLLLNSKNSQGF